MKKIIILITAILLVITIASGCGKPNESEVKETVEKSFEVTETERELEEVSETIKVGNIIHSDITVEVIDITKEEATLIITAPDIYKVLQDEMQNSAEATDFYVAIEEFENKILEIFENKEYDYRTVEIKVPYVKTEAGIEIIETEEYKDAINGGIISFANDYLWGAEE